MNIKGNIIKITRVKNLFFLVKKLDLDIEYIKKIGPATIKKGLIIIDNKKNEQDNINLEFSIKRILKIKKGATKI